MSTDSATAFIARWSAASPSERANSHLFLSVSSPFLTPSGPVATPAATPAQWPNKKRPEAGSTIIAPGKDASIRHHFASVRHPGINAFSNSFFSGAAITTPSISAPLKNHQMPPIHFVTPETMAKRFTRAKPADISEILETLCAMGHAHRGEVAGT